MLYVSKIRAPSARIYIITYILYCKWIKILNSTKINRNLNDKSKFCATWFKISRAFGEKKSIYIYLIDSKSTKKYQKTMKHKIIATSRNCYKLCLKIPSCPSPSKNQNTALLRCDRLSIYKPRRSRNKSGVDI